MSKKLVIFLMSGRETPDLAAAAVQGGADLIELGFPFSDPLADGPVIRHAAERALAEGMRTKACLECLAEIRGRVQVPLVPFVYSALLEAYGHERFVADARSAGAGAILVPDLPVDAHPELRRIQLVAPTSTDERIQLAADTTDGWLYLVTLVGTTGARSTLSSALAGLAERARRLAPPDLPLYAGFGISTPEQARAAADVTDGVIVGSRAIEVADGGPEQLRRYVASLRTAIDDA
ncbi:MAG: tryptophan synthase subunit alpha [Gaiellaceae bacterium]